MFIVIWSSKNFKATEKRTNYGNVLVVRSSWSHLCNVYNSYCHFLKYFNNSSFQIVNMSNEFWTWLFLYSNNTFFHLLCHLVFNTYTKALHCFKRFYSPKVSKLITTSNTSINAPRLSTTIACVDVLVFMEVVFKLSFLVSTHFNIAFKRNKNAWEVQENIFKGILDL